HLAHLQPGDRVRPAQRQHPQDRRTRARSRHRSAQEHLPAHAGAPRPAGASMKLIEAIEAAARELEAAGAGFGHGTSNAFDEAAWLVLWSQRLPLDELDAHAQQELHDEEQAEIRALVEQRIATRKPAAYLTREAWLQGVPFYVDERAIVPRSFIAELLAEGTFDAWLGEDTLRVLDLCSGNG